MSSHILNGILWYFQRMLPEFIVRDKPRFERMVMPKFFAHKSFKSFRRQVNLYDFKRLENEECSIAYYHEAFLRGRPDLLDSIKLRKSKDVERKDSNELGLDGDPDFYRMDVISPVPS